MAKALCWEEITLICLLYMLIRFIYGYSNVQQLYFAIWFSSSFLLDLYPWTPGGFCRHWQEDGAATRAKERAIAADKRGQVIFVSTNGCFQKSWYPQIIHFNRVFQYKPSILGYPNFWKHPNCAISPCKTPVGIIPKVLVWRRFCWWSHGRDASWCVVRWKLFSFAIRHQQNGESIQYIDCTTRIARSTIEMWAIAKV